MVKLWRITYFPGIMMSYQDVIGDDIVKVLKEFNKYIKKDYVNTTLKDVKSIELRGW